MKVLFISSTHNKAGRGSIVRMQGESLSRQGVEVYYFGIDRGGFAGYISSIFQLEGVFAETRLIYFMLITGFQHWWPFHLKSGSPW